MPENESPATVAEEAPAATGEQAQLAPALEAGAATSVTPAPEAPKPPEPDLDALLGNDEFVERLLKHDKAQHRIKSAREADVDRRADEKAQARFQQWQAEAAAQARQLQEETERQTVGRLQALVQEDPTHPLAQEMQGWIEAKSRELAASEASRQAERQKYENQRLLGEAYGTVGRQVFETLTSKFKIEDADAAALDPRKFPSFADWFMAAVETVGERKAKAALSSMLPREREALRAELRGEGLDKEQAPPGLPAGVATSSEGEFLSAFASGKSNDFAQAKRVLGL